MVKFITVFLLSVAPVLAAVDIVLGVGSPRYIGSVGSHDFVATWLQMESQTYSPTNWFRWSFYNGDAILNGYASGVTNHTCSVPPSFYGAPVKYVGDMAFYAKSYPRSITLPDSVTTIGSGSFWYASITNIIIGTGVTYFDTRAFSGCVSLQAMTIKAPAAPTLYTEASWMVFDEGTTNTVFYPSGASGYSNPWNGLPTVPY